MDQQVCGVEKTLKIIGGKWTLLILKELCEDKKRFGELQRNLAHISPKTLSQRLKELEQYGIVRKKVFAEVPLHVEYSLTPKGKSLKEVINTICDWAKSAKLPDITIQDIQATI